MTAEPIYLTWLNAKGGFEYFFFNKKKEYQVDIESSMSMRKNILPGYPASYGQNADTIIRPTSRVSRNMIIVISQHLNIDQINALSYIKSSVLVQIVYSRNNRRTVIVDEDSFKKYNESEKLFTLQFKFSYTDEIPAQKV